MEYLISLMLCALVAIAGICAMAYFMDSTKGDHNPNRVDDHDHEDYVRGNDHSHDLPRRLHNVHWTVWAAETQHLPLHVEMN